MGRDRRVEERKKTVDLAREASRPGPGCPASLATGLGLLGSPLDLSDPGYQGGAEGGNNKVFPALNRYVSTQ